MNTETIMPETPEPEITVQQTSVPDLMVDTSGVLKCYGMLILGMPMLFSTQILVAVIGFFVVINATIWGYKLRKNDNPLLVNHSLWIKRSFWISTMFTCFAATVFWMIFATHAERGDMDMMIEGLQKGTMPAWAVRQSVDKFYAINKNLMFWDWIGCFAPVVLHAVLRFIKGYRRADAGLPIENVKTWWI